MMPTTFLSPRISGGVPLPSKQPKSNFNAKRPRDLHFQQADHIGITESAMSSFEMTCNVANFRGVAVTSV